MKDLTFTIPVNPVSKDSYWIRYYKEKANTAVPNMPIFIEKGDTRIQTINCWTLDIKFHNFFVQNKINYRLEFTIVPNRMYICFLTKEDAMKFKLYWVSAQDVYDNY